MYNEKEVEKVVDLLISQMKKTSSAKHYIALEADPKKFEKKIVISMINRIKAYC